MQPFKGIIALLMLALLMPLPRACAAISSGLKVQQACCEQCHARPCCEGSAKLCGIAQLPADTVLSPTQNPSALVLPTVSIAVAWALRNNNMQTRSATLRRPAQHSPPGLVIAATIVLRI
jgi:hypothetical protein